jgi:uncharacterized protein YdcH (DUF465 family)
MAKVFITKAELLQIIREAKDQNKDGENDFDDVKIARMKASGMSDEEIKEKHPELFKEYKDKKGVPKQYQAHKKGRRSHFNKLEKLNKQIKQAEKDGNTGKAESLKKKRIKLRDEEEAEQREKNEGLIREYVRQALLEKKKKKKKKKCDLSKATEKKVRAVATKKGYTFGSLKGEYCKGLGAFYSSGSRPGMTAHGWAMARVNKATPSKSWANVKKSKAKKKK